MNKLLATLLTLLVGVGAMPTWAQNQSPDLTEIIITHQGAQNPDGPRMPSPTRIEAYYDSTSSSLIVILENAGNSVNITMENTIYNDSITAVVFGTGEYYIPITNTPGVWYLTIELGNGDRYYGFLVLIN